MLLFCRASFLLVCFLQVHGHVLMSAPRANTVFLRSKRANMFLVEEILQGDLERECYEEMCSYEEAREYFEDNEQTDAFWTIYYDGDQCDSNPCFHGGNCTDQVGGFRCSCAAPYSGPVCELGPLTMNKLGEGGGPASASQTEPEVMQCPTEGPTVCHQLCTVSGYTFTCSCLSGFKLHTDKRTCLPEVAFPCGRIPDINMMVSTCHHGSCPWQVALLNHIGEEQCAGVVLNHHSILTSARCIVSRLTPLVQPSGVFLRFGNHRHTFPLRAIHIHDRFKVDHQDYDLALLLLLHPIKFSSALIHLCLPTKDFSENILMHSGRLGVTARPANSGNQNLVYMTLEDCRRELNVSHPLSNKMFCMRNQNEDQTQTGSHGTNRDDQNQTQTDPHGTKRNDQDQNQTDPHGNKRDHQEPIQTEVQRHYELSMDRNSAQPGPAGGLEDRNINVRPSSSPWSDPQRSEDSGGDCRALLPGTPVATEEQGIVYLTGILISTSGACGDGDGVVFTKLSRHLNWIKPRLQEAEDHMTSQVIGYPEDR